MEKVFHTKQFMAGNSPAVRIPASMAFPHQTELTVIRENNRIIVQPTEATLENLPALFAALGKAADDTEITRPEFIETPRDR